MARSSECKEQYAQKVLDTADIVREAMFRQLTPRLLLKPLATLILRGQFASRVGDIRATAKSTISFFQYGNSVRQKRRYVISLGRNFENHSATEASVNTARNQTAIQSRAKDVAG
jgi:hypothetical protein